MTPPMVDTAALRWLAKGLVYPYTTTALNAAADEIDRLQAELARHTAPVTDPEVAGRVAYLVKWLKNFHDVLVRDGAGYHPQLEESAALIERLHRQNAPVSDGERADNYQQIDQALASYSEDDLPVARKLARLADALEVAKSMLQSDARLLAEKDAVIEGFKSAREKIRARACLYDDEELCESEPDNRLYWLRVALEYLDGPEPAHPITATPPAPRDDDLRAKIEALPFSDSAYYDTVRRDEVLALLAPGAGRDEKEGE